MINVILVEDHALFRLGLMSALKTMRLEVCVVGEAESGKRLFELLQTTNPDIVLLDIMLPDISGVEIAQRMQIEYPDIKILVISAESDQEIIKPLIEAGIKGYISKNQSATQDLMNAIRVINDGLEYFGKDIAQIIYNIYVSKKGSIDIELTDREREIIALCRDGIPSKEIAQQLNISPRTVDTHKNNIFKKLGITNTMEMVNYALKHGIITFD